MKYQTKTRVVEAITFDELVEYGRSITPPNHLMNGMPWSFEYKGRHVTHENDTCYLILGPETDLRMTPGDMLIAGEHGEIYTCMHDTFEAGYEPAEAMTEFKSYRAESRKNYGASGDPLSLSQLQAGALLRIADATEKMAQRHTELISSRDYFESAYRRESEFRKIAERSNAALRGQITKLRKREQDAEDEG